VNGVPSFGYQPQSLVQGTDGDIYFTNAVGVSKLDSSGGVTTVYTFPLENPANICTNGCYPTSIMQGSDGNFYLTLAVSPGAVAEPGGLGLQPGAIVQVSPTGQFQLITPWPPTEAKATHPVARLCRIAPAPFME